MPELRIILLVVGVLFVAGIAGFEWWRSRGNRPLRPACRVTMAHADSPPRAAPVPLPDINVVRDLRVAMSDSLPVIELASTFGVWNPTRAWHFHFRRRRGGCARMTAGRASRPGRRAPSTTRSEPYIGQDDSISAVRVIEEEQPVRGPQLVLALARAKPNGASSPCASFRASTAFPGPRIAPGFQRRGLLARTARHLSPSG